MLERLSEKFALKLVNAGIIPESDAEIYVYGFFQTVMLILNIITTLLLGFAFGLIIPCILLNLAYIPIRISAGGHHADNPFRCYINSTIMIAILLAVIKWVPVYRSVTFILLVISSVIVWILAPVETENNPLDEVERHVYRKRSIVILIIEIIAVLFFLIFSKRIAATIVLGLLSEALMLLIGIIKKH